MIWRDGVLPADAPPFSDALTYQLLSYGDAMLGMGLRLSDLGGNPQVARLAFEHAAGALESAITNGDTAEDGRGFNRILAASAYHLARYSARSYSLLHEIADNRILSPLERALAFLVLRSFDNLYAYVASWRVESSASDDALVSLLEQNSGEVSVDDADDSSAVEALILAVADNYMSAMALFLLALERGDGELVAQAVAKVTTGLSSCAEMNFVPQWWVHRVTIHILRDLWSSSFHVRLPKFPNLPQVNSWTELRELFVALLYRRARAEIELWPSQIEGADRAVTNNEDLVVSLPTSAGKTRIAELCILRCLSIGKRVVFVTPLRALSAQTEVTLQRTFVPLGKRISNLYGSVGTNGLDDDILKTSDIVVATPEKLDFALRSDPTILDDVGLVVLDEGHMIGIGEREVRYEVQIQRLLKRPDADARRIVCLSAILPEGDELNDFVAWLSNDSPLALVKDDWRPTRLRYGEVVWKGDRAQLDIQIGEEKSWIPRFIVPFVPPNGQRKKPFPCDQRELCLATAWKLVEEGRSVLIFCPQRRSVEPMATTIVDLHERGALPAVLKGDASLLSSALAIGKEWLGDDHAILQCLRLGIAIHHGALPSAYRKEVERLLREGVLQVTVSSPTLAQGLNLSASALVVQGLTGHSGPLEVADFRNIEGRAGRAYVDVEGLVLHPMFDRIWSRQAQWRELIANQARRQMESGLLRLLSVLLARMQKKLGNKNIDHLVDYVVNNAKAWEFPSVTDESAEVAELENSRWEQFLTSLDTAVLSMLGEQEVETVDIEGAIDKLLSSSLFERRLRRQSKPIQRAILAGLNSRAKYIWTRTSALQRRGYFLAGVGYNTGSHLDAIAAKATPLLITANGAILASDEKLAIEALTELANYIFAIPTFRPDPLPSNWKKILSAWLEGRPIHGAVTGDPDAILQFVEGGLVYRLPWGLEALRVHGLANNYQPDIGLTLEDFELRLAAAAVETGSLNRCATLLMQAGFTSRIAAIKVVTETKPSFDSGYELNKWLNSHEIDDLSADDNWPTPESSLLWRTFRANYAAKKERKWRRQILSATVEWTTDDMPMQGTPVHLFQARSGELSVHGADFNPLGYVTSKINPSYAGLFVATVSGNPATLDLVYYGPTDLST